MKNVANRHRPNNIAFDKIYAYIEMFQKELQIEANPQYNQLC